MTNVRPQQGSKMGFARDYLIEHPGATSEEVLEAAQQVGLPVTMQDVGNARYDIRKRRNSRQANGRGAYTKRNSMEAKAKPKRSAPELPTPEPSAPPEDVSVSPRTDPNLVRNEVERLRSVEIERHMKKMNAFDTLLQELDNAQ